MGFGPSPSFSAQEKIFQEHSRRCLILVSNADVIALGCWWKISALGQIVDPLVEAGPLPPTVHPPRSSLRPRLGYRTRGRKLVTIRGLDISRPKIVQSRVLTLLPWSLERSEDKSILWYLRATLALAANLLLQSLVVSANVAKGGSVVLTKSRTRLFNER